MMKNFATLAFLALAVTPAFALAKPSLWTLPKIDQGLFDIGVAYGVKENCTSIGENKLAGAIFAWSLVNHATSQGYSVSEVRNFIDDDDEKAILRARVTKYLKDNGLDPDVPNALCEFGRDHIAEKTQVGKLLRIE